MIKLRAPLSHAVRCGIWHDYMWFTAILVWEKPLTRYCGLGFRLARRV
jgi:hypothetical protein